MSSLWTKNAYVFFLKVEWCFLCFVVSNILIHLVVVYGLRGKEKEIGLWTSGESNLDIISTILGLLSIPKNAYMYFELFFSR